MPKTATTRTTRRQAIPFDPEPLTPADFKAIGDADAAFARGDYCSLDDLGADLQTDVARLGSHKAADRDEIRTMLIAALGCNLAWGRVDGFMYLVRTIADRGRLLTLTRSIREADAETGCRILQAALSTPVAKLTTTTEIEAMRGRLLAWDDVPARPRLQRDDFLAAFGVFLIVVASTFPVALPFVFILDPGTALFVSRAIGLAMLFMGGLALGRYAGYGSWKTGVMMAGIGTVVIVTESMRANRRQKAGQ